MTYSRLVLDRAFMLCVFLTVPVSFLFQDARLVWIGIIYGAFGAGLAALFLGAGRWAAFLAPSLILIVLYWGIQDLLGGRTAVGVALLVGGAAQAFLLKERTNTSESST